MCPTSLSNTEFTKLTSVCARSLTSFVALHLHLIFVTEQERIGLSRLEVLLMYLGCALLCEGSFSEFDNEKKRGVGIVKARM